MRFARGLSADLEIKTPQALNAQLRRYEYPPGGIALRSLAFYGYTEVNEARRAEALLKGTKRRAPEKSREERVMQIQSKWAMPIAAEDAIARARMYELAPMGEATSYAVERASELLFKVQDEATTLILNAEILRALTRETDANLEGHLGYLHEIKTRINAIWDRTFDLRRISPSTLAWQRETIAELSAHGAQTAVSTQAAIDLLRESGQSLCTPEYRHHVTMLADASQRIRDTMTRFFDRYMMQQRSRRETALIVATE